MMRPPMWREQEGIAQYLVDDMVKGEVCQVAGVFICASYISGRRDNLPTMDEARAFVEDEAKRFCAEYLAAVACGYKASTIRVHDTDAEYHAAVASMMPNIEGQANA